MHFAHTLYSYVFRVFTSLGPLPVLYEVGTPSQYHAYQKAKRSKPGKRKVKQCCFPYLQAMSKKVSIQINQPTRCNSFTSLLLDVYVWLNMFRAPPRPSSGAYNCINSLWFYLWRVVVAALLVVVCQTTTNNAPTTTLQR